MILDITSEFAGFKAESSSLPNRSTTLFHILKITINGAVGLYCISFLLLSILHIVSVFVYVCFKLSYYNEYKSYLRYDQDVE